MVQRVEAWGNVLEFPDDMSDDDMAEAITANEAHLNPDASLLTKGKAAASQAIDAGLSMLKPKKSIADQAEEQSAETAGLAAPQVKGAPVRRDFYNRMVAETPQGSSVPDTGIVSRTVNAAAQDKKAQGGKQAVASAITSTEPQEELGLLGTLKEGAIGTARNIGAAIDTAQGDEADVVSAAKDASNAEKDPALSDILADISKRKKALKEDHSWLDAIGTVGSAAMKNPKGAGLLLAEQLPNSGAALGVGAAGAAAGSIFGPVGTVIGGIAGLFGATTALETGGMGIEAASDGSFTPDEQKRVLKEGAIKGGVITAVDTATLGLTNFIMGTTRRAVERATVKALTDKGIDVTNKAAVLAASKSPDIAKVVKEAQDAAQKASTTLGRKLAKVGGATALETVGEGAGEYLGEMAATGKADKVEAVIEAFSSLGQSAGEIAFTAARNKSKLATIAGKPVNELSDNVLKYTAKRGGEKAKAAAQAELKRRETQGADPDVQNAPESTTDAVDRIISTGKDKAAEIRGEEQEAPDAIQDDVFDEDSPTVQDAPTPEPVETLNAQITALTEGRKPGVLLTPGEPMPAALPEGVQAAEIPGRGILLYLDEATLQAAQEGRMGEALGYGIDEKPNTDQVITARDADGTVIQDVATDGRPEVERAAVDVAGPEGTVDVRPVEEALAERDANSPEFEGIKEVKGPAPKTKDGAALDQKKADLLPGEQSAKKAEAKKESPAKDTPAPKEERKAHPVRPLIESLIKRRAAARQGRKDLSNAIDRAKEVMDGKRTDAKVEGRYFRLQAKAFERADAEAAKILGQIAESIKDNAPKLSRSTPQTETEAFKKWFAGSKVADKDGKPLSMYHGTSSAGFDRFDTYASNYGLMGMGGYFTVDPAVASDYTKKGKGISPGVYKVFLSIKNPLDMDAKADPKKWQKQFEGIEDYHEGGDTNEIWYRAAEDVIADRGVPMWEGGEAMQDGLRSMGYDGITHIGGGRVKSDTVKHKVFIAFDPTQIKSAISNNGSFDADNPDIRLSRKADKHPGQSIPEVQKAIEPLQKAGFKKINVAATQDDLPQKVKEQIESRNAGNVRGVYLPDSDEIFIVADQLNNADEAVIVALHEARHRGLRKMFGSGVDPVMRQIYATNKRVRDAADRMMLSDKDMSKEEATEEVLADMPIDQAKELNGWKRLVKFIKDWIAEKLDLAFTDAQVEQLVSKAEVAGLEESQVSSESEMRLSRTPGSGASWNAPEPSKIDNLIYSLQNRHIDMKRVMESIRDTGAQLAEKFDAYLQEELFHGRAAKRTKDFVNSELKPLIAGLKLRGISIDELDKYLHARHAQEANALIAQRDPKMQDGGSGMTNKDAQDYLANLAPEKRRKLDQTARKVDDIISKTRDLYVSYGLIDQATADSWQQMFQHYVPLMREDKDGGMGIGQGFSIKGKEAKHRTGSKRAVVDILANIALQRERAIVRGEKNRVSTSLYGLAKLNPNPEFWTTENVPQRHFDEKTGQVVERADPMYKNRNNVVVAKIRDSKGNVTERAVVFNEDNERAMRMAQAIKNLDATQLEGLMGVSAKVTRYFAAINTQYNPVFGIVNLTRDLQASLLNLSSTPIAGSKAAVMKNIIPAIHAIYSASRGERKGNQATSGMAALWDEMQKEGGMTGYRDLFKTSEDRANAIKHELDPTAWMNSKLGKVFTAGGALKVPLAVAQKQAKWLFDLLSDYNQTLEGAMRLSVYKAAIDKGLSKPQAASIAKNISVNFNRKGQSGQQAGALYAFFNAAMQGTARIGETMTSMNKGDIKTLKFNSTGKKIIVGGITLGAVQALALAAAGFDDDEPPEFVRERSLIIPIGDKKYVTIPMPLGFHAIPNVGRISTEFALGGFKKPAERTAQLFMIFAEAFNPIGSSSTLLQTVSFTATDPLAALSENQDWTGKPIAKEDFNKLSPTPGFSRNKDTATAPAKWIAETINTISGGNKYVPGIFSPTADQIDFLVGQVTGGVGRESAKAQQSISAAITGEDLPPHKIPLVGRFYGSSDNSSSQGNAFYKNLKRINEIEAELKGRRKDRLPVDEFKAENPEHSLVVRANFIERLVAKQRKKKSELLEKKAPREEVKAVEERITNLMAGFNSRVKELREEARQ